MTDLGALIERSAELKRALAGFACSPVATRWSFRLVRPRDGSMPITGSRRRARTELARVNRELKQLRAQLATLEETIRPPGRTR